MYVISAVKKDHFSPFRGAVALHICEFYIWLQPAIDSKYLKKKLQKAKCEFALSQQYLHSIYIVLGVVSNLTDIDNTQKLY